MKPLACEALMNLQEATRLLDRVEVLLTRVEQTDNGIEMSVEQALVRLAETRVWVADADCCVRVDNDVAEDARFRRTRPGGEVVEA